MKEIHTGTSVIHLLDDGSVKRILTVEALRSNLPPSQLNDINFAQQQITFMKIAMAELKSTARINIPDSTFKVIKNEQVCIECKTQYITGKNLFEMDNVCEVAPFTMIEELLRGFRRYLKKGYSRSLPVLWNDISTRQFMFGSIGGGKNKLYLIDLDPIVFGAYTRLMVDDANARLRNMAKSIATECNQPKKARIKSLTNSLPEVSEGHNLSDRHPIKSGVF